MQVGLSGVWSSIYVLVSQEQYHRVMWHSRRGMLELDELLVPYARDVFPKLPEEERQIYLQFIDHEDPSLFQWLIGRETPPQPEFQALITKIKDHAKSIRRN